MIVSTTSGATLKIIVQLVREVGGSLIKIRVMLQAREYLLSIKISKLLDRRNSTLHILQRHAGINKCCYQLLDRRRRLGTQGCQNPKG